MSAMMCSFAAASGGVLLFLVFYFDLFFILFVLAFELTPNLWANEY
jgi:hypothetical protein